MASVHHMTKFMATQFPTIQLAPVKRYLVFVVTSVIVFAAGYYALMHQSIKYSDAINADARQIDAQTSAKTHKPPRPEAPAGWLYLGDGDVLEGFRQDNDLLSALYYSLSIQSTLGPPHYPPNKAWKLLTGVHIMFILAATVVTIV